MLLLLLKQPAPARAGPWRACWPRRARPRRTPRRPPRSWRRCGASRPPRAPPPPPSTRRAPPRPRRLARLAGRCHALAQRRLLRPGPACRPRCGSWPGCVAVINAPRWAMSQKMKGYGIEYMKDSGPPRAGRAGDAGGAARGRGGGAGGRARAARPRPAAPAGWRVPPAGAGRASVRCAGVTLGPAEGWGLVQLLMQLLRTHLLMSTWTKRQAAWLCSCALVECLWHARNPEAPAVRV